MALDRKDVDDEVIDIDKEIETILNGEGEDRRIPPELQEKFIEDRKKKEKPIIASGTPAHGPG